MKYSRGWLAKIRIIVLFALVDAEAATGLHSKTIKFSTACEAADYLNHMKTQLKAKITGADTAVEAAHRSLERINAALAAGTSQQRQRVAPIRAALGARVAQAEQTYSAALPKLTAGLEAVSYLEATQHFVGELTQTVLNKIQAAATQTFLSANGAGISLSLKESMKQTCGGLTGDRTNPNNQARDTGNTITLEFYQLKAKAATDNFANGPTVCNADQAGASGTCKRTADSTNIMVNEGPVFEEDKITATRKTATNGDYTLNKNTPAGVLPRTADVTAALAAIKAAEEAAATLSFQFSEDKAFSLTSDAAFKDAAVLSFLEGAAKYDSEKHSSKLEQIIKNNYGDSDAKLKENVWDQVDSIEISAAATGKEASTTLKQITTISDLRRAAGYYMSKNTKPTSKQDQCTSHKAEPACGTLSREKCTDPCEWKGGEEKGKCEAKGGGKEEVKAEKDDKATNTTGSNSFVIKASPLLLAVLLLG